MDDIRRATTNMREPDGWTYLLMGCRTDPPLKIPEQPSPANMLKFHMAEALDETIAVFSLVSRDDEEKIAYFMKGSFEWGPSE